jgi:hypothetical protein
MPSIRTPARAPSQTISPLPSRRLPIPEHETFDPIAHEILLDFSFGVAADRYRSLSVLAGMGNCLERSRHGRGGERCAVWAEEKVVAAAEEVETCKGVSEPAPDKVKIRITRKHLEELLRRVEDGKQDGVPARDVISELISSSNVGNRGAHGQWRPSLQSIPE